ncbi:MAG: PKD domain-containing protein [Sedimentisphaerales bacterium]|nr:PKD domain-containing protein [Sedimentisphaerales bacterium]
MEGSTTNFNGGESHDNDPPPQGSCCIDIFKWEFGDGYGSYLANPTHTYTEAGYYVAKLSVKDNDDKWGHTMCHIYVVEVDKIIDFYLHEGPLFPCLCDTIDLQAIPNPSITPSYPYDQPQWTIESQPPEASASLDPASGSRVSTLSGLSKLGDYVVRAKCGSHDGGDAITITHALPEGCECSGPHDSNVHWTDLADYWSTTVKPFGQFGYWHATYEVDFKYKNDCIWVCEISNVNAETEILVSSQIYLESLEPNWVSVAMASQVPCYDAYVAKYDLDDTDLTDDEGAPRSKYWCHIATMFHERKHRTDWKEFYGERLAIAIANCESFFQCVIDCDEPNFTTCQAAENHWEYPILGQFASAWVYAKDLMDDPCTPNLDEAEVRAYKVSYEWEQPISAALPEGCTP